MSDRTNNIAITRHLRDLTFDLGFALADLEDDLLGMTDEQYDACTQRQLDDLVRAVNTAFTAVIRAGGGFK